VDMSMQFASVHLVSGGDGTEESVSSIDGDPGAAGSCSSGNEEGGYGCGSAGFVG
jgi:hypothetical protein